MTKIVSIAVGAVVFVLGTIASTSVDAQRAVRIEFTGSSHIVSTKDGRPTPPLSVATSYQSGVAGGNGQGVFATQTVSEAPVMGYHGCPALGGALRSNIVVTYNDGSQLQLTSQEGSLFCTDGLTFVAMFVGEVVGGTKRFEGATGTWTGSAKVVGSRLSAMAMVDLD
jgi:hypothetical protein